MRSLHPEIQVTYRYPVHFTTDLFSRENPLFRDTVRGEHAAGTDLLFIVDEGVARRATWLLPAVNGYCEAHGLRQVRPPLLVPGGERVKNEHEWVLAALRAVDEGRLCRHSYVVAVGGGAVLDMAGLAAATAHRGLRLVRVPTTVLAQNDSGVGVKNGVNAFGKKNFLGTFAPPHAVLNDFRFLEALHDRDWRSGISEAVKVALIRDAEFFAYLEAHAPALAARDMAAMQHLVYRCAELHLRHIATGGDPFESGSARPLDFGHWAAHKLEQLTGYALQHGEAVAIGIALDSTYAYLSGFLPQTDWDRILRVLSGVGFVLHVAELDAYLEHPDHPRSLFRGLAEFREHLGGELTITLLEGIGRGFEVHRIDPAVVIESIALLRERNGGRVLPEAERNPEELPLGERCRLDATEGAAYGTIRNLPARAETGDRRILP